MLEISKQALELSGVDPDSAMAKSHVCIGREYKKKKAKITRRLHDWAVWKTTDANISSSMANIDGDVIATGHDHCLLTDFDSLMIEVDQAISSLNADEKDLIGRTYRRDVDCPITYWCMKYGKSKGTYHNRHRGALIHISNIVK